MRGSIQSEVSGARGVRVNRNFCSYIYKDTGGEYVHKLAPYEVRQKLSKCRTGPCQTHLDKNRKQFLQRLDSHHQNIIFI